MKLIPPPSSAFSLIYNSKFLENLVADTLGPGVYSKNWQILALNEVLIKNWQILSIFSHIY